MRLSSVLNFPSPLRSRILISPGLRPNDAACGGLGRLPDAGEHVVAPDLVVAAAVDRLTDEPEVARIVDLAAVERDDLVIVVRRR